MTTPIGPTNKPRIHFDEDGQYTVFTGKVCSVCNVGLTSRNRFWKALMCAEHGKEHNRARVAARKPPVTGALATRPEQDPRRRNLQSLFSRWVKHPTEPTFIDSLTRAMSDYEMIDRLRRLPLPASAVAPLTNPGA